MAARAAPGIAALFGCCDGFTPGGDLAGWLRAHHIQAAAGYVNWVGRTVRQVREEAALYDAVQRHLQREWTTLADEPPTRVHLRLRELIRDDVAAGRLTLSPERADTARLDAAQGAAPRGRAAAAPALLADHRAARDTRWCSIIRRREPTEPEVCPRTDPTHVAALAAVEDHDVTNSFSAIGTLKPGVVRRWATIAVLWVINFAARHVYTRGRLARVRTIHFARWVFLDRKTRVIFLSNYDDSLESYMDDFINKVGFGLNLSFSHGIGYPTHALADLRRQRRRAEVQGVPAAPPDSHAGLVQGVSGAHRRGPRAELTRAARDRLPQLGDHEAAEWVELL